MFDRLVEAAWESGEPGVVYLDTINRANPTPHLGAIEATNPCAEQPLLPYESCTLGSINVARFVIDRPPQPVVDYPRLAGAISTAVRFLDNVLDCNHYPFHEIEAATMRTRKIGLGIMGFADLLIALHIPYDSEEALKMASTVMAFVQSQAHEASRRLASGRGTFPAYPGSSLERHHDPRRNATVTTIAPTDHQSFPVSPGIESSSVQRAAVCGGPLLTVQPSFLEFPGVRARSQTPSADCMRASSRPCQRSRHLRASS